MEVKLIDHMGADLSVVNAARVSFAKKHKEFVKDKDERLIRFLARNNHWTPFAHTSVTLHVKAPIFVARQLGKHQTGLVWNEVSRRYVDDEPEFFMPTAWRKRPNDGIKQGSSDETVSRWMEQFDALLDNALDDEKSQVTLDYDDVINICKAQYQRLLDLGAAPEMARMVLPQSMYTEWYWTGNIAAFARVCNLRLDPHTQKETRDIAKDISALIEPLFPISWKALTNE